MKRIVLVLICLGFVFTLQAKKKLDYSIHTYGVEETINDTLYSNILSYYPLNIFDTFIDSTNKKAEEEKYKAFMKEQEKYEQVIDMYYNSIDRDFFKKYKWGFSDSSNFMYGNESKIDSSSASNTVLYKLLEDKSNDRLYDFAKVGSDTIYVSCGIQGKKPHIRRTAHEKGDNSYFYNILEQSICSVKDNSLYINNHKAFDRDTTRIEGYLGLSVFSKHYNTVDFWNKEFKNVYEFYLIRYPEGYDKKYLIWFTDDYDIIRMDYIGKDGIMRGFLIYD